MTQYLHKLFLASCFLLLAALSAGCAGQSPTSLPPTPTPVEVVHPPRAEIAPTPTPATLSFPLPAPTLVPVAAAARPSSQNCIDCHTDEELLKATATEVEAVETQSEGEG